MNKKNDDNVIDKWSIVEIINKPFDDGLNELRKLFETLTKRNENIYERVLAYKTNNPSIYYNILEGLINYLIIKQIIIVYRYYNCYVINLDNTDEKDKENIKEIVKNYYFDFASKGDLYYSLDIYIEKHLEAVRGNNCLVINELNEINEFNESDKFLLDYINYAPYNYNNIVKFNELVEKELTKEGGDINNLTKDGILEKLFVVDDDTFKLLIEKDEILEKLFVVDDDDDDNDDDDNYNDNYILKLIYSNYFSKLLDIILKNEEFDLHIFIKSSYFVEFIEALIKHDKINEFIDKIKPDCVYTFYRRLKEKYLFDKIISLTDNNNKNKSELLKFNKISTEYDDLQFYIKYGETYFNKFIKRFTVKEFVKNFKNDNNKDNIIEKLAIFNLTYLRYILKKNKQLNEFVGILEDYKKKINGRS